MYGGVSDKGPVYGINNGELTIINISQYIICSYMQVEPI